MGKRPKVNFGLLPFSLTDASVSGNLALRLRAEAEVDVNAGGNSASAGAGAYLILTEAKFGAAHDPSSSCKDLIAIDVDANGGAFAEAGYKIGTSSRIIGPSTTTTFYSTHITTCLATGSPTLHKTSAAIQTVAQAPDVSCNFCLSFHREIIPTPVSPTRFSFLPTGLSLALGSI